MATPTPDQLRTLTIVERCASLLSILGIATIIGAFCLSQHFRNPINRIIFINAFYNILDVAATTISLSGPAAGDGSSLCQFQGFLMQMFPLADVLWTLAMACNVFLIVFYKYDAADLRKLEIKYIAAITTLCGIPALSFLFVHTPEKGHLYGSVTLWCSIAPSWVKFRVAFFYGPIWGIIFIVLMIYCLVGIEIFKQKHLFESFSNNYINLDTVPTHNTSFNDSNDTTITTVQDKERSQSVHTTEVHDGKDPESASSSTSTSHQQASISTVQGPVVPSRGPVSFRQYILTPLMFFVVMLAVWIAPTVNRIGAFIDPHSGSYPLLLAVGAMGSLRGFWNGVVFVVIGMKVRKRQLRINQNV